MGNLYSVSFSSQDAAAVATDIFDITGSTLTSYRLRELSLGQVAAALTSSAIETLTLEIYRGSTIASGGATAAVVRVDSRTSATSALLAVVGSSTPGSSGTSAQRVFGIGWNTQVPIVLKWDEKTAPTCKLGERLQVRLGAPAATMILGGTIVVEELGRVPGSTVR